MTIHNLNTRALNSPQAESDNTHPKQAHNMRVPAPLPEVLFVAFVDHGHTIA
jgi:hypothetical protein